MHYLLKHQILQLTVAVLCGVTHAAQHPVHTLQTEAHIATAQQQF
jgi:hypothetical protein